MFVFDSFFHVGLHCLHLARVERTTPSCFPEFQTPPFLMSSVEAVDIFRFTKTREFMYLEVPGIYLLCAAGYLTLCHYVSPYTTSSRVYVAKTR